MLQLYIESTNDCAASEGKVVEKFGNVSTSKRVSERTSMQKRPRTFTQRKKREKNEVVLLIESDVFTAWIRITDTDIDIANVKMCETTALLGTPFFQFFLSFFNNTCRIYATHSPLREKRKMEFGSTFSVGKTISEVRRYGTCKSHYYHHL